ncbi:MAG: hypothetical protein HN368_15865, partial [Spirochaetales bacterium]|nr:hypothetical protein [Spirochaetales bacterium]
KKCCGIFKKRGYRQLVMPAAFRCARHVSEIAGSTTEMTIHPKIQDMVIEADAQGSIKREIAIDNPVDPEAVEKVLKTLPEFDLAYREDGLKGEEFGTFGGTTMTLSNFDATGWQKLKGFPIPR